MSTVVALADALGLPLDALTGRSGKKATRARGSPLVRRLADRAEELDGRAVASLLAVAKLLPTRPKRGREE